MRPDLLALTEDALAALANRGLVKRALKDLDAGTIPTLTEDADGTVRAEFPDGTVTTFAIHSGLSDAECSCGASGGCRHRIGLVLAYQRANESAPVTATWSPGEIDDDTLTAAFGARAVATARKTVRAGFVARVHRPTEADPVSSVDLPSCTVRFLVPGEIGHAHTDAAAARRAEMIVLAVWAFRAADETGATEIEVGGHADHADNADNAGLDAALGLVDQVLVDGVAQSSAVLIGNVRRVATELADATLRWPASALTELAESLSDYHGRAARFRETDAAELIAEVHARQRAAGGSVPTSRVLGTDEPAEVALRRVRLIGLGCRVTGTDEDRTAQIFLAHPASATVLVLRHQWVATDTGAALGKRRLVGSTVAALAGGNVVSESVSRSASRLIRIAASRVAKTTVTPLGAGSWDELPSTLPITDYRALCDELGARLPRLIRPRVEAEDLRVVRVAEVRRLAYHPGDQRLDVTIADEAGTEATISAEHSGICPGALDALAAAIDGSPQWVSGLVRRVRGELVIRPIAVLTAAGLVVPDLAAGAGDTALAGGTVAGADPLAAALDAAIAACAQLAHQGLRHVSVSARTRLATARAGLARVGLTENAARLAALHAALVGGDVELAVRAWVAAELRLLTSAEFR
ncbi:MAG TPA: hypothetical protein VGN81_35840 [Pseudonocardiaceae bacterium]|jgi:hypothetical protein